MHSVTEKTEAVRKECQHAPITSTSLAAHGPVYSAVTLVL